MKRLVYRPEAAADVRAAFEWYEQQRDGLGGEFLAELANAERALQTNPLAFRILRRDARRIMLRRFPYQLFYRVTTDVVVVVACFHGRRSPKRLDKRR
ncbi:MAG TPA: type II toxin-antitoxin system RelE/ParE family toxin [Polyangia bacterium]|nr:type II toxin-antitoxin system RelE/ParE family toxin [Polyangia bacterium]